MPSNFIIAAIAALLLLLGVSGFLLSRAYQKEGALQTQLITATSRLKEINDVQKEVDKVHGTNNALPDDKLFDGLRPAPGSN